MVGDGVLKQTSIPPEIPFISCTCLLCKYISSIYKNKRDLVIKLAIQNTLNINEPNIIEIKCINKPYINGLMTTKYGRVLTEFKSKLNNNNNNNKIIEYKKMMKVKLKIYYNHVW